MATLYYKIMAKSSNTEITKRLYAESLYYDMKLTEKYSKLLVNQIFADIKAPISPEELIILDITNDNPKICQRDIAKFILKDRANTGRLLESLEKKCYIRRIIDTKNNRLVKSIEITEDGYKILQELKGKVMPMFDEIYSNFSENDILFVKDFLKKMRETFNKIVEIQI